MTGLAHWPALPAVMAVMAVMLTASAPAAALASAQTEDAGASATGPYVMPRSEVWTLRSPDGTDYLIHIARPERPPPAGGYPVLYLLDGNESFAIAAETLNRLGRYAGMTPGIVVGIGYPGETRRKRDYTPALPPGVPPPPGMVEHGGADAFLELLSTRILPLVEGRHPIDPDRRTLAGYSLGGLFVLHALFRRPDLFRAYAASSPSIWYGRKRILASLDGFSERLRAIPTRRRLLLTAGEYEQSPPPGGEDDPAWRAIADLSRQARMVDNARDLAARLAAEPIDVRFRLIAGESHASGSYPALREALLQAFSDRP